MATEKLCMENIGFGQLMDRANAHLADICDDVVKRPRLKRPRKVTIEVMITPDADPETDVNFPAVDWSVSWSVPGAKGMQTKAFVNGDEVQVELNNPDARQPMLPNVNAGNVVSLAARKESNGHE